jgi:hypothetical protein
MDLVKRISDKTKDGEIDVFQKNIERRNALDDTQLDRILTNTFLSINRDALPPAQTWAFNQLSKRLQNQ